MNDTKGHLHPITLLIRQAFTTFDELDFSIAEGPEMEEEFYNFDALNVPADHPARDMQDTFWLKGEFEGGKSRHRLMRTQTSPVQVRHMETHEPPFRIIVPGKVFRNEATDATHEAQFYQLEGLVVGEEISMAHLKGMLGSFFKSMFGEEISIRFRPSFFPFTEPSVEVDASCWLCGGTGMKKGVDATGTVQCSICKGTGWIEMGGAGMVHPHVFNSVGVDGAKWRGFAFGLGLDRLAMLKYGIDDVRLLYSGDLRFVNQF
jgi:phenylalanyl-tRNA synthetase alpha chain